MSDDDLQFELTVKPNLSAVEEAMARVAAEADAEAKHQKKLIDLQASSTVEALEKEIQREKEINEILEKRQKLKDELTAEVDAEAKHQKKLIDLRAVSTVEVLEKEIQHEKEINEILEKRKKLKDELTGKNLPMALPAPKTLGDKFKDVGKSLFDPKNLSGFLGGMLGGGSMLGTTGGIVGGTLAGPEGAKIGSMLAEMIPGEIAKPAKAVADSFRRIDSALKSLDSTLGPVGLGFDLVSGGLSSISNQVKAIPLVGEVLGPMTDALAAIPGIFKSITETLTSFASKASPATFTLFQHAVEDSQAVIGQRFVPVLELMTDGVRLFGDVLTTLLPTGDEVREALSDVKAVMSEFSESLGEVVSSVGPLVRRLLVDNLRLLGTAIYLAVKPLQLFLEGLNVLQRTLSDLLGINFGGNGLQSSMGAAARTARFSTAEGYLEQLQLGAYSQGQGPTQAQVPGIMAEVRDILVDIFDLLNDGIGVRILEEIAANVQNDIDNVQGSLNGNAAVTPAESRATFARELLRSFGLLGNN